MAKTKLPLCIGNRSLAIALHLAGCRIIGYWRTYTKRELDVLGIGVEEAVRKDKGGADCFFIEDTEEREAIEKAFDETAGATKSEAPIDIPAVSNADAAKIVCMAFKVRQDIQAMRRNPRFAKIVEENGKPSKRDLSEGEHVITHPGFKIRSATKK